MGAAKLRRGGSPSPEMERSGAAGGGSGAGPSPPPPTRNGPVFTVTGRVLVINQRTTRARVPQTWRPQTQKCEAPRVYKGTGKQFTRRSSPSPALLHKVEASRLQVLMAFARTRRASSRRIYSPSGVHSEDNQSTALRAAVEPTALCKNFTINSTHYSGVCGYSATRWRGGLPSLPLSARPHGRGRG